VILLVAIEKRREVGMQGLEEALVSQMGAKIDRVAFETEIGTDGEEQNTNHYWKGA